MCISPQSGVRVCNLSVPRCVDVRSVNGESPRREDNTRLHIRIRRHKDLCTSTRQQFQYHNRWPHEIYRLTLLSRSLYYLSLSLWQSLYYVHVYLFLTGACIVLSAVLPPLVNGFTVNNPVFSHMCYLSSFSLTHISCLLSLSLTVIAARPSVHSSEQVPLGTHRRPRGVLPPIRLLPEEEGGKWLHNYMLLLSNSHCNSNYNCIVERSNSLCLCLRFSFKPKLIPPLEVQPTLTLT